MSLRSVFAAVVVGTVLIVAAFLVNARRPTEDTARASAELVRATGKCAECHRKETGAVVHEYERSRHAAHGVSCLDCHRPGGGQEAVDHRGFTIASNLTAKNCAACHATEYEQYARRGRPSASTRRPRS